MNRQMIPSQPQPELQLELVAACTENMKDNAIAHETRGVEARCLELSDAEFAAITADAWCSGGGNGGCSTPFYRHIYCPSYGQA
ncbi:hypothetical protein M0Q28_05140 [Patescibacteria group bacterium]|jgi:hypothetical protein|nr:hypothetical protein [Patescibacteria group bacterium]